MFNTSTLGYKLISGQLRKNRKHSEQLNKFVAGLLDSDGWISLDFCRKKLQIQCGILQSASNDPDFQMLRALKDFYNLGTIIYREGEKDTHSDQCKWTLRTKESKILFNRIGKHLRIKGTHFENLAYLSNELKDIVLTDAQIVELKEFSKCSRDNSKWLKYPKHPSWSWVAGYLAGDGHFEFRLKGDSYSIRVSAVANEKDIHVLNFLKTAFKGSVLRGNSNPEKPNYNNFVWKRGLGKSHKSFSIPFLKKLRMYMCVEKKYNTICGMLEYLERDTKTNHNDLERESNSLLE